MGIFSGEQELKTLMEYRNNWKRWGRGNALDIKTELKERKKTVEILISDHSDTDSVPSPVLANGQLSRFGRLPGEVGIRAAH